MTQYENAVSCTISEDECSVDVFQPKSVKLLSEEIVMFNNKPQLKTLIFIFRGKIKNAFNIDFEQL